jgi:hypothetical protein
MRETVSLGTSSGTAGADDWASGIGKGSEQCERASLFLVALARPETTYADPPVFASQTSSSVSLCVSFEVYHLSRADQKTPLNITCGSTRRVSLRWRGGGDYASEAPSLSSSLPFPYCRRVYSSVHSQPPLQFLPPQPRRCKVSQFTSSCTPPTVPSSRSDPTHPPPSRN